MSEQDVNDLQEAIAIITVQLVNGKQSVNNTLALVNVRQILQDVLDRQA